MRYNSTSAGVDGAGQRRWYLPAAAVCARELWRRAGLAGGSASKIRRRSGWRWTHRHYWFRRPGCVGREREVNTLLHE
jgi:hypothetical protein